MEQLSEVLTQLALDPFGSLLLDDEARVALRAALDAPDASAIAGSDWDACKTCSDPGTDQFDPYNGIPTRGAGLR